MRPALRYRCGRAAAVLPMPGPRLLTYEWRRLAMHSSRSLRTRPERVSGQVRTRFSPNDEFAAWQQFDNIHTVHDVQGVPTAPRFRRSGRHQTHLRTLHAVQVRVEVTPWRFESSHPHSVMCQDIPDTCVGTSWTL